MKESKQVKAMLKALMTNKFADVEMPDYKDESSDEERNSEEDKKKHGADGEDDKVEMKETGASSKRIMASMAKRMSNVAGLEDEGAEGDKVALKRGSRTLKLVRMSMALGVDEEGEGDYDSTDGDAGSPTLIGGSNNPEYGQEKIGGFGMQENPMRASMSLLRSGSRNETSTDQV